MTCKLLNNNRLALFRVVYFATLKSAKALIYSRIRVARLVIVAYGLIENKLNSQMVRSRLVLALTIYNLAFYEIIKNATHARG